ncbi:hypothetical protein [Marisediminicola sp. LYQ134]|uniref:hypothetical protein n=1 Tax=Marisediminicola sp. LYQ134 TaxID=3391061 RepID=UPI0039833F2A
MGKDLESPHPRGKADWDALYRARGNEVSASRPVFTGDVFTGIALPGSTGKIKDRTVMVIQHPCSMRTNGVDLAWQVLVAEVTNRKELSEDEWTTGHFNLMPLPSLRPELTSQAQHQAANFDNLYMVPPDRLTTRIAALSPLGVNLLLQRWVNFSSRVIVPSYDFHAQTVVFYEEADLVEEWCDEVDSGDRLTDAKDCMNWLRADIGPRSYQEALKDVQSHSVVRKAMRAELKSRRETF